MTIKIDVKSSGIESAYVDDKPFDQAVSELQCRGYDIISLKQLADLRVAQGKNSHIANHDAFVSESFVYNKDIGIFLVRKPSIMANAGEATECHRRYNEFYLTPEQVKEVVGKVGIDSVQFKDSKPIQTNRFEEDERMVFAFGESAKVYGEFLKDAGISEMPIYLAGLENKPFARPASLHWITEDNRSGLYGNNWNFKDLYYHSTVRGVRNFNLVERIGDKK